jgi:lysozyme family protein
MEQNFKQCLKFLYEHEGGLTNLKNDRGGLTNLGVTHEEYDRYRRLKGETLRSVSMITMEEAEDIYHTFYWKTIQANLLPGGIDNAIFDMAVNNGVVGASKAAQRVANKLMGAKLSIDGHIGPISCDVIDDCEPHVFIDAFCDERLRVDSGFFNWGTFGRAWTNRVNGNSKLRITGVREQSKLMAVLPANTAKPPMPIQPVYTSSIFAGITSLLAKLFHRA